MSFKVDIKKDDAFPVINLIDENNKTSVEIYSFGALLNAFIIGDSINIIDGFSSPQDAIDNITNGFKSAKLSPFVCRTTNGKYVFKNEASTFNKFYLGNEAIHGLLYDALFEVVEYKSNNHHAFAMLQYDYAKKDEGFPFSYACTVKYTLETNNHLTITTTIKNNDVVEMPLCDGWHPYFKLSETINELSLKINSNNMLEFNEHLVPTGKILSYQQFQKPEIIGNTVLDNCFVLNDATKPACVLKNNVSGLQLTIQPDNAYPYLQVYTPPHRKSIAIENLSAAPDAFNNKVGLTILQPQQEKNFTTSYTATKS
jgi:aldose 1-epimerase